MRFTTKEKNFIKSIKQGELYLYTDVSETGWFFDILCSNQTYLFDSMLQTNPKDTFVMMAIKPHNKNYIFLYESKLLLVTPEDQKYLKLIKN